MKSVRRLYKELKPSNYILELHPDVRTMSFTGTVVVKLKKTGRPSQRITFHQHGLKITAATIVKHDKKGDQKLTISRINNQNTLDEVRLHTREMIYSGNYTVNMTFSGTIARIMNGLYPCFFNLNGKEHTLLATQFESHYARNVFPCIDEPEAKATFDLTLIAPKGQTVLANTPVKIETPLPDSALIATTFDTTPKMSTYLLAFAIGELHSIATKTKNGTDIAVWATIAQPLDALEFALDVAKRSVEFFEDYFGAAYPLPKLDHIALPDFSMGAMENWGLITYRERRLVAYKGQTSQASLEQTAMTIVHETAHMWFGDLVTMKWWDEIWLNESFARLMESQALNTLFPEWHIWDNFASSVGLVSLRRDATAGVQAVHSPVRHPDEINSAFDPAIVYGKGARLLNMLKTYIGERAFQQGLQLYFKRHAYGNTTGSDLWSALTETSGIDIAAFMDPWLERSGLPVVTVDQADQQVTISQERFLEDGQPSDVRRWPVPLFANSPALPERLDTSKKTYQLTTPDPILVNIGSAGHYITRYTQREPIAELVRQRKLSVADRLLLLNGLSMLSKAGYEPFANVLAFLEAYSSENSDNVWSMITVIVGEAHRYIDLDESIEEPLKAFTRTLIAREYGRLGWDELPTDSPGDRKLRATIIGLGARAEDPAIVTNATTAFMQYRTNGAAIPADIRAIVFATAVREAVPGALEFLLDQHDTTISSELQSDITLGVSATHDPKEARTLLDRLTDPDKTKLQDVPFWLAYLLANRFIREVAWQWMVEHWPWIEETFKDDMLYDRFPKYAADACSTKQWLVRFEDFFTPKLDDKGLKRNIEVGINEIKTRVAWLERDLPGIQKFFK